MTYQDKQKESVRCPIPPQKLPPISVVQPTQNLSSVLSVSTVMIEGAELTSVQR